MLPAERSSRLSTRYAAKNTTSITFAASPGWKFSGPMLAHRRAPLIVRPTPGTSGSSRKATPPSRSVYLYRSRVRVCRTNRRVATNAPTPTAIHTDWMRASFSSRRAIVMKPIPLSIAAIGSRVPSALGARRRIATWAMT